MGVISARVLHGLGYPTADRHNLDEMDEIMYCVRQGCETGMPEERRSVAGFTIASESFPGLEMLFH